MSDKKTDFVTYDPEVFDAKTMEYARAIILTGEGSTTDERWQTETPYLRDLIGRSITLTPETLVIDYGCGVGRMAKALIEAFGCRVLGIDISAKMRALAVDYVGSDRFSACTPDMLDTMAQHGLAADAAISIWVLQHCLRPREDIARIHGAVKPAGELFIMNNIYRAVPTKERAWVNDGLDMKELLKERFTLRQEGIPADEITPRDLRDIIFWATYDRPA